jgi:pimeloyl-ACP methyl ester carboxylesterase
MYEQTAASFENPDFVDCVLHSYRHRNFNAPSEPRFVEMEKRLATRPRVEVPTIVLHGGDDGFGKPAPDTTPAERAQFTRLVARRVVAGAGHFVPHEAPPAVAEALVEVLAASK